MHHHMIIEGGGNFWGNFRTAIGAIGSILVALVAAYLSWKQYQLERKKYHTALSFDIKSLQDHALLSVAISLDGKGMYEYLKLQNYGDGYAKNITIILTHTSFNAKSPKEKSEYLSLLGPWSVYNMFSGCCGMLSTYNQNDKLNFEYIYTDGFNQIHKGNLFYIVGEEYILIPQNNS